MGRQIRVIAGVAAAALLAAGCASAQATVPPPPVSKGRAAVIPGGDAARIGAADTAFGLSFLRAWCRAHPADNLVFSPQTLAAALGMAYLGARGSTAQAMAGVLHLPRAASRQLLADMQARTAALGALGGPGVTVSAANQVWADPSLTTLRSYLDAVATGYAAGVERAPLLKNPQLAAEQIDHAIASATHGQITRLLSAGTLNGAGWVLTSALYLNAAWATPFDPGMTEPGSFTTASGRQVTAKFMWAIGYRALKSGGWTGVQLPYRGGKLSMYALLPPASAGGTCALPGTSVLASMTTAGPAAGTPTYLGLPRLNLRSSGSARELLAALGMGLAFTPAADFSALSPQACCIAMVQQAATLQVGEKGTVASAAAAAGIEPTAGFGGPELTFDRPFVLVITSTATGDPLFMARVADPASA